ncbi:CRISPR-associated endonuclease Cas2 [Patescibacteria group bacterium]|nr:CRISPR-associated endonuclease Cas2 [Patescibacteria group bacterium]
MEKLEEKIAQRARREKIQQKITLAIFRLTARNARAALAPEAVLRKHLFPESTRGTLTRRLRQAVRRLEQKGLVQWKKGVQGWSATLTEKGMAHAEKLHAAEHIRIRVPKTWDGKWRIVMFDIWESRRLMRDKLRLALQKAGFRRIQNSVWICPFDCEELVAFLRVDLRLGGGVIYLIAEGIENDQKLRQWFGL